MSELPSDPSPSRSSFQSPAWFSPLLLALCGLAAWAALQPLDPPAPPAAGAGAEISVERALSVVGELAAEPRAVGTPGHREARRKLQRILEGVEGLEVRVQEELVLQEEAEGVRYGVFLHNVLARLPGDGSGNGSVLLAAHYDSFPGSPGAADNGAAVAALVETLRVLSAGPPLQRDVVALFSDGEEIGLLGARAFAAGDPWSREVSSVLNFEARGSSGPSIMFETGPGSGSLVELYADAVPSPVANSISSAVYNRLPNDTDFTVFRQRGVPGLNFAFIHGVSAYHSQTDVPDRLSPASLYHHAATALVLTRHLAGAQAPSPSDSRRTFFTLPGAELVSYPEGWNAGLTIAVVVVGLGVLILAWRRRDPRDGARPRKGRTGGAGRRWLLGVLFGPAVLLVTLLGVLVLERIVGGSLALGPRLVAGHSPWFVGWAVVGAGLALLPLSFAARRLGSRGTAVAGFANWLAVTVLVAWVEPAAAYLFLWPALFGGIALAALLAGPAGSRTTPWAAALLVLAAVVWCLLWVPTASLVTVAMPGQAVVILALTAALAVLLLAPQLLLLPWPGRSWLVPVLVLVAGLGVTVAAGAATGFSEERPERTGLYYLFDSDGEEAWWVTTDTVPPGWTAGFVPTDASRRAFPRFFEGIAQEMATAPAPELPLPAPRLEVLEDTLTDEGRRLRLRLTTPRRAYRVAVGVRSPEPLQRLQVADRPVTLSREVRDEMAVAGGAIQARLRLDAVPEEGVELELLQAEPDSLVFDLVDWSQDLPDPPPGAEGWNAPPPDVEPRPRTGVLHRVEIGAAPAGPAGGTEDGDREEEGEEEEAPLTESSPAA